MTEQKNTLAKQFMEQLTTIVHQLDAPRPKMQLPLTTENMAQFQAQQQAQDALRATYTSPAKDSLAGQVVGLAQRIQDKNGFNDPTSVKGHDVLYAALVLLCGAVENAYKK